MTGNGRCGVKRMLMTVAVVLALGCSKGGAGEVVPKETPATLKVDNLRPQDMTIYIVPSGAVRERLGIARASAVTVLTIPVSYSSRNALIRFVADPIGGRALPVTQDIDVGPGDEVLMRITP